MIATAPGKLIVSGEYAVLDGAPALVIAVNRRVVARRGGPRGSSAFLLAVADEIAREKGEGHPAARAAMEIVADSKAFYAGEQKLGLGSSAAVTVAATALALAAESERVPVLDRGEILAIASSAHANAQGQRGARGSGADIAASVFGGAIAYQRPIRHRPELSLASSRNAKTLAIASRAESIASPGFAGARSTPGGSAESVNGSGEQVMSGIDDPRAFITARQLVWPSGVTLIPFFTGASADTAMLVTSVLAAQKREPAAVNAALDAIDQASRAACQACAMGVPDIASNALLAALALGGNGIDRLALATGVPLVPPCVRRARAALAHLRGTAKTTGAGGGDIGVAVIPSSEDVSEAKVLLIEAGCQPLDLNVDTTGVDLQPDAR